MRSSTFRLALAFFSSSWLGATGHLALAEGEPPDLALALRLASLELEHALAKESDLYFVLDPAASVLSVRVRGVALKEVPVRKLSQLVFRPLFGGAPPPPLPAPSILTVSQGPGDADRETIAPTELRPYGEEEPVEPPPSSAGPPGSSPATPGVLEPERPATYRVGLDNGWQLLLTPRPPGSSFPYRFLASVRDGWARLRGQQPAHPPLVVLVVDPEEARGLHHLFRTGRRILLRSTSAEPAQP